MKRPREQQQQQQQQHGGDEAEADEAEVDYDGDEYAYGQPALPVAVPQAGPGPSRLPTTLSAGASTRRVMRAEEEDARQSQPVDGDEHEDEEEDDDDDDEDDEDEDFSQVLYYDDAEDDSADEFVLDEAEQQQDDDEEGGRGADYDDDEDDEEDDEDEDDEDDEEEDEFPAAPDVAALRLADQYAMQPLNGCPLAEAGTGAGDESGQTAAAGEGAAAAAAPEWQSHSRYRAGGMQRIEELGFYGADEDVQVGEDEIARLVAAIQGDEELPDERNTVSHEAGPSSSTLASAGPSAQARQEKERRPQIRRWDAAMIQEKEDFEDELRGAHGMKRKRSRRTRNAPRQQNLSAEIKDLLSEANSDYVMGNYDDAIAALHQIISIEPYARAAWTLLMLCFREKEQHPQAVQAGIILASLSSNATAIEMFKELADSSLRFGARQQAVYCLQQAIIRSSKTDTDAMWDRALILEQLLNEPHKAARGYAMVLENRPWDIEAKEAAIRIYYDLGEYRRGAALLEVVRKWMMERFPVPSRSERTDVQPDQLGDAPDPVQMELIAAAAASSSSAGADADAMQVDQPQAQTAAGREATASAGRENTYTEIDLYSHVEFLLYAREPFQAIAVLRETVRWLQGRAGETYWDDVEYDDREFDEVRPGRDGRRDHDAQDADGEEEGEERRAFDRSGDLLAAGRRRRRLGKGSKQQSASSTRISTSGSSASQRRRGADEDDDDDGDENDNEDGANEGNDGNDARQAAQPGPGSSGEIDIELQARRRQWEAWESRAPVFGLSPSLRVLLGRARLMIGDEDEAERQFSIVLEHDVTVHADLFADVAQAYMEYGYWQEAFDVLLEMDRVEVLRTAQYYEWLGTCCQNLGKLQQAARYLQGVVDARPNDLTVRYQLAEIYAELGDNDSALRLAASLLNANRSQAQGSGDPAEAQDAMMQEPSSSFFSLSASAALGDGDDDDDLDGDGDGTSASRSRNRRGRRSGRRSRGSGASAPTRIGPTQREKLEAMRELEYRAAMSKLAQLEPVVLSSDAEWWRPDVKLLLDEGEQQQQQLGQHDDEGRGGAAAGGGTSSSSWENFKRAQRRKTGTAGEAGQAVRRAAQMREQTEAQARARRSEACRQWLDIASNLIDGFKNRKGMFKRDAKTALIRKGYGRRGPNMRSNIQSRATALLSRLQDRMLEDAETHSEADAHGVSEFRGIQLDDWVLLFVKYAFVLTKIGEWDSALEHLKLVCTSHTMQLHDRRRMILMLGTLSCALYARDFNHVFAEMRNLHTTYFFQDDLFRLSCSLANVGGIYGLGGFMNSDLLKYYLRRIRQYHALSLGTPHMMRAGKWTVRARFGKARHLSNLENRRLLKRIPLGFKDRMHELVEDGQRRLEEEQQQQQRQQRRRADGANSSRDFSGRAGGQQRDEGDGDDDGEDEDEDEDEDDEDDDADAVGEGGYANEGSTRGDFVPEYASLTDIRPDRPGWEPTPGANKSVTLQDLLRNGYPSRPSVVAEMFYGMLMLLSKSNLQALYLFTKQYSRIRSDPLISLLCGVAFLTRALNRQVDNRHHAVLQGFAYLSQYRKLRARESEEVEYNFGRAFHQIGLLEQAVHHYEKVLRLAEAAQKANGAADSEDGWIDEDVTTLETKKKGFATAREAAFNLALIYNTGGSPASARALYERWLVV
ncbi:transcription factor TFIIIC subunit tfc4 [Tilletia horrida]|nr:transcription factor TFIIIC subunit tfc4 [Tilletia horrida]